MQQKTENLLKILRKELPFLKKKYKINSLELFGSYVRKEQSRTSDLDLLITYKENPGLIEFLELEYYLSDLLNVKVDLVMRDSLKPTIGKYILKESKTI